MTTAKIVASLLFLHLMAKVEADTVAQEARVMEIRRHTSPSGNSAYVTHNRRHDTASFNIGLGRHREELTIDYAIPGGQFHHEKISNLDPLTKYGCYGQTDRPTTYYIASANGFNVLSFFQFEQVSHLFPLKCGGEIILKNRTARLLADNRRMAQSIEARLEAEGNMNMNIDVGLTGGGGGGPEDTGSTGGHVTGNGNAVDMPQPTMVLLVPFCPNSDNEALTFLQQWHEHATPVNVAGYLFAKHDDMQQQY